MNIMTLIQRHPLLRRDLMDLGIDRPRLNQIAASITRQLGGTDGDRPGSAETPAPNLCFVLHRMDRSRFVSSIDARRGRLRNGDGTIRSHRPPFC